uniref:Uncharacterized protein n=1 Tax=Plectus sambesii TaxID=2011161 RepID=A0A914WFN1_9BILA
METTVEMLNLASRSEPSASVTYRNVGAGLLYPQEKEINYASLDRARDLVAQMPSSVRETLLALIEQGLIDPQSVFNLIDDKSEHRTAICAEEFVRLASTCMSKETGYEPRNSTYDNFSEGWWRVTTQQEEIFVGP